MGWGLPVGPEVLPWFLAGAVLLGLAGWLIRLDPEKPVNWAFAGFLSLRGLLAISSALYHNSIQAAQGSLLAVVTDASAWLVPALHIVVPLAALNFAFVYRATYIHSRRSRWASFLLLLLAGGALALYVQDPGLWQQGTAFGPLFLFAGLTYLSYALVALMLGWDYVHADPGPVRRSFLLVTLAFAITPLYVAVFEGVTIEIGLLALGAGTVALEPLGPYFLASHLLVEAALVPLVALLVLLVRDVGRRQDPQAGPEVARFFSGLGLPTATAGVGAVAFFVVSPEVGMGLLNGFEGLWDIAFPLIITYALLRHQLFGVDVKLKRTLKQSAVAGMFAFFFMATSEALEALLPVESTAVGIMAAGAIALVLNPVQNLAERLVTALMPDVRPVEDLSLDEQTELYREQVRIAWADGKLTEKDERLLEVARKRLGLSRFATDRIEQEVRAEGGGAPEDPTQQRVVAA